MDWNPDKFCRENVPMELPITEPPCKECRHWYPHVYFSLLIDGTIKRIVQCCVSRNMKNDFKCYERKNADENTCYKCGSSKIIYRPEYIECSECGNNWNY